MKKSILVFGTVLAIIPLASEALLPGESIVRDPNTGDYIITYENAVGRLKQSRFVPSTKIDPTLRSRFENQHGLIRYRYAIRNGSGSKQPLIGLTFDPVSNLWTRTALPKTGQEQAQAYIQNATNPTQLAQMVIENTRIAETPSGWSCDVMPAGEIEWAGYRIACSFDDLDENKRNGLQAGNTISGFGFYSMDLPGVGAAQLEGFGDMGPGFVDEGPDGEISDQLEVIQKNDYVSRDAAVPTIAVPNPFDAAALLDRIRTEMLTWPGKQLLNPAFAAQLDRYMVAAAEAYRLNNTKAGRENVQTMRKLLAKEHRNLDHDDEDDDDSEERKAATRLSIDRLAARVLDFDLRYVLKRSEREHEEAEGRKER
jgi:hypothetical protein